MMHERCDALGVRMRAISIAGGHIKVGGCVKACRLAGMLVFALLLAGCDSCGDWISPMGGNHVCRQQAPRPQ
jgi:hypothetical protein